MAVFRGLQSDKRIGVRGRELQIKVTVDLSEFKDALKQLGRAAPQATARALFREAHVIRNTAIPLTPVDTGALRRSYYVDPPVVEKNRVRQFMGVGGPTAPYAIDVHERVELYHRPPTQAKFLSEALNRTEPGRLDRIGNHLFQEIRLRVDES